MEVGRQEENEEKGRERRSREGCTGRSEGRGAGYGWSPKEKRQERKANLQDVWKNG